MSFRGVDYLTYLLNWCKIELYIKMKGVFFMENMDKKYEALFTPWKIGNVEIKNRIVMCPMGGTSLFGWFELTGCHFDKEAAKLFLERANNNVGLIIPGIAPLRDTFWGKWLWNGVLFWLSIKVCVLSKS